MLGSQDNNFHRMTTLMVAKARLGTMRDNNTRTINV